MATQLAVNPEESRRIKSLDCKARLAIAADPNTEAAILDCLYSDPSKAVRAAVAKHKNTPPGALFGMAVAVPAKRCPSIAKNIAANPNTPKKVRGFLKAAESAPSDDEYEALRVPFMVSYFRQQQREELLKHAMRSQRRAAIDAIPALAKNMEDSGDGSNRKKVVVERCYDESRKGASNVQL